LLAYVNCIFRGLCYTERKP